MIFGVLQVMLLKNFKWYEQDNIDIKHFTKITKGDSLDVYNDRNANYKLGLKISTFL